MFNFEALSYRDDESGLRARRAELIDERRRDLDAMGTTLQWLYARRVGRIAGGAVAMAGAAALVLAAIASQVARPGKLEAPVVSLTPILLASVLLVPIAMIVGNLGGRFHLRRLALRELVPTSDVRQDLARLGRATPARWIADAADRLETRSIWAPLVGWAVLAPLTLHFLFAVLMTNDMTALVRNYDVWILLSLLLTVPAHAVLAILAVRFARRLRTWSPRSDVRPPSAWAPWVWTAVAGCVPGVVLYLVPPALVAVTGLIFVPATFSAMRMIAIGERALLDVVG